MNVERARVLWKKALPYVLAAFAFGTVGTVAAKHFIGEESCCKPGAACCKPGAACCHSNAEGRVSER
jgi:hypothetical protein